MRNVKCHYPQTIDIRLPKMAYATHIHACLHIHACKQLDYIAVELISPAHEMH